ncbi:MAG: hypothetical protein JWQ13_591 [Ramlibacter sp.]|jgi:hypothetical protein|nr:hypothetical protein [Ramlibacter sp.]
MSMHLQVEASSAFQAQSAGPALFSQLLQPKLVQRHCEPEPPVPAARIDTRLDVPLSELSFRHLETADEIAGIVHLRNEIQLVAASGADPAFVAREKKETRRALSRLSSAAAHSSAPSASFR